MYPKGIEKAAELKLALEALKADVVEAQAIGAALDAASVNGEVEWPSVRDDLDLAWRAIGYAEAVLGESKYFRNKRKAA